MFSRKNDRLLRKCLDLIASKKESVETCITNYPQIEEELHLALQLKNAISPVIDPAVSDAQRRKLKVKILSKIPDHDPLVTKSQKPRYTWQNLKRRFSMSWIIIISTILTLVSGGGIVYASGDALPGEVLYPVKTWVEDVRLAVASDEADIGLQFKFADERLAEIEALIGEGALDGLDLAVLGYGNQTQLLNQTMAKIKAQDPDEAVRLRTDLETKLQEQARRMEDLLDDAQTSDEFVRERVRLMLQTNTQLREHIHEADDEPDAGEETAETEEPPLETADTESGDETQAGGEQNQNGKNGVSGKVDNEAGAFKFSLGGKGVNGVYAMISGTRFECSVDGDMATCPAEGSPNKGDINLYDAKTNELLFTFQYEHAFSYDHGWQGEKNDNGDNGTHGDSDGGGKENNQNANGK